MTAQRSPSLAQGVARVDTVADLRRAVDAWRADGHGVGLAPTMGALHAGHLALVEEARRRCPRVVVSVFVNPAQFAPGEDFDEYPRDEAGDMAKLAALGVDLVFAPGRDEIYPAGFATTVTVAGVGDGLCAATRPHFFAGVATVVTKLLVQCLPDVAVFGEKDYQQLVVVRRLARDLDIPVEIVGVPTVREADGLAMSSRNAYLTPDERRIAGGLNVLLADVAGRVARGEAASGALAWGRQRLEGMGFDSIDYLELRDAETLEPVARAIRPARVLAAVCIGGARLIDNRPVAPVAEAAR
ncbi:MAG: pantoate--beta-alanine ligase [Proteobacteria bacterium]|nr:pantoate--beta-alanine ligase [Pseudomonadota bacterium]